MHFSSSSRPGSPPPPRLDPSAPGSQPLSSGSTWQTPWPVPQWTRRSRSRCKQERCLQVDSPEWPPRSHSPLLAVAVLTARHLLPTHVMSWTLS